MIRAALRGVLLTAAFAVASAACVAPAGAQTLETVHVAAIPVDVTGNLYYALDLGLFKRAGLDVQITTLSSTAATTQAVATGAVDFGTTNLVSIALAHERGIPIAVVAPAGASSSAAPLEGILVATASPIKSAKDLNGKTVITSVLRNGLTIETAAWMEKNGGDYQSLKWIEAPNPTSAAMVSSGRVDASTLAEPFLSAALAGGDVRLLTPLGAEIAPVTVIGGYITSRDYAGLHPDVVKKFRAALMEAGRWANGHRAAAATILQSYSKQPPAAAAHHAVFVESFSAADLQPIIDAAARYGVLKASFPAADLVIAG
jgi:NitT/TauT family transport system substrate-binding protein